MPAPSKISQAADRLGARPGLLLVLILALGFTLRAIQTRLGLPYVYNFDDPQIAAHALNIMKTGDWNPHFFAYGSLMIYVDTLVDAVNYLRLAGLPMGARESMIGYDQLTLIDRIVVPMEGRPGWYWAISHPSFYLWDRYATALFGTGTIAVTYAMARRIVPGAMALVPALLLAIVPIHIVHSALTTTDVPVGFMVGVATLAAMVFAETGGLTAFVTSLVFVGLAAATKYNSGLVLVTPLLALGIRIAARDTAIRWWHWLLLIAVPAATFLAVMPFALLDFKRFITDLAQSVSSYHAPGPSQSRPGIRHLRLILTQFGENLDIVAALLALAGAGFMAAVAGARRELILLLVFPLVFVLYMSTSTPDYHRNFMQLYPFLCLYAGYGLWRLSQLAVARRVAVPAALLILAAATLPPLYRATANAAHVAHAEDTRSAAVATAKTMSAAGPFEIAEDLHIHEFDLGTLGGAHSEAGHAKIAGDICTATDGRVFILPSELHFTDFGGGTPEQLAAVARFNALMRSLRSLPDTVAREGPATPTWGPPVSPGILIVRARSGLCGADR